MFDLVGLRARLRVDGVRYMDRLDVFAIELPLFLLLLVAVTPRV